MQLKPTWKINEKAMSRAQERMSQAMMENEFDQVGKLSLSVEDLAAITRGGVGMMRRRSGMRGGRP